MKLIRSYSLCTFFVVALSLFLQLRLIAQPGVQSDMVTLPTPSSTPHENFEDPKLVEGELKQSVSLMMERANFPTYTRELWHVEWRKGDPIDLYIILPKQVVKPAVILYLYSFPADTDRFLNDIYCKTVTSRGLAAVGFVSALTGQRYHDRPWKEWFISQLPEALGATSHDVQMIINFLETRPNLDAHRVGIFGQGSGGSIAVLAAASDPRIRAVDLLDPWGDWPLWLAASSQISESDRAALTSRDFLTSVANLEPMTRLRVFRQNQIRLQQTSFDTNTSTAVQVLLAKAMPPGSQIIKYMSVDEYAAKAANGGKILDWLTDQLTEGSN